MFLSILLGLLLAGCQPGLVAVPGTGDGTSAAEVSTVEETAIVPTVAPYFIKQDKTPVRLATAIKQPSATPLPQIERPDVDIITIPVYSDGLHPDWEIVSNTEVSVSPAGRPNTYEGRAALAVTPLQDFGQLIFRVKPEAQNIYLRDKILALAVWLSAGPGYIDTDELGISVFGSDQFPYWVDGDQSAYDGPDYPFSETRLYYLGLNNAIPPNTWGQAINWLNDREFDPDYQYVTGFYIKNDEGVEYTYYVDEVVLILIDDGSISVTPESSPTTPADS